MPGDSGRCPVSDPRASFIIVVSKISCAGLKIAASPRATTHGRLEAHLIPTLSIGINLLDGFAETAVSLDLDTSAALDLSLTTSNTVSASADSSNLTTTAPQWGGCLAVETGFSVDAVTEADLLDIFSEGDSVPLFSKTFDLYKRCFGSEARRRALPIANDRRRSNSTLAQAQSGASPWLAQVVRKYANKNGCQGVDPSAVVPVVEEKLSGSRYVSPFSPSLPIFIKSLTSYSIIQP